ncbi:FlgK family flagellar hook-associated protein [Pseudoprimorskyibacter insulae]|uniref:Flagellar hook-associated protein 1 n=1 Tax=Pseudoprimorskyibacter insulae TaxID=1695997 RepID=A0A2R8AVQ9_9RHOB|nr:flagellar basal body rod C-terminal domain-containing protein [Pseudoprimorskyibacter insulae]SPF80106.1 Flagellar hook-associated protein 1 [Pseudoprimorskyibacter insulae]
MASLYDIGKSGLTAARTALGVTGENIANAETDGYKRRDTLQVENAGAQATPLVQGAQAMGVSVVDVRRAFDELLAERVRIAGGTLAAAQGSQPHLEQLELRMQPGVGGLQTHLGTFFDSVSSLSAAPEDSGLRNVVMEAGKLLAGSISDLATSIMDVGQGIRKEAQSAVDRANGILGELSEVFSQAGNQHVTAARNPLLDRRDKLLEDLAEIVDINVSYKDRGQAEIRMGNASNGPLLLSNYSAARMSLGENGKVILTPLKEAVGSGPVSRTPTSGLLYGLATATGAINQALKDVDYWARQVASDMNTIHESGLDAKGRPGGIMFDLSGWDANPAEINRGTITVSIEVTDPDLMPKGPLDMTYDGARGLWQMTDSAGEVLGEGAGQISAPGMVVKLEGTPKTGDRFELTNTSGSAKHMRFAVGSGDRLAAAASLTVGPNAGNLGTATLGIAPSPATPITAPSLGDLLTDGPSEPVSFLEPGIVGHIPAGASAVTLTSQPRDAMLEFGLAADAVVQSIQITTAAGVETFSDASGLAPDDLVTAVNTGQLLSANGTRLSELGLVAASEEGAFGLMARAGTPLPDASLTTQAGTTTGVAVSDAADAADIAIFTREGRQISGTPLLPSEVAALMTEANGFTADAVYRYDTLNKSGAYGDLTVNHDTAGGAPMVGLGAGNGVATWAGSTPAPSRDAETLIVDWQGQRAEIAVPKGASAAQKADLLNDALPATAKARTAIALDLPATGTVRFNLTGLSTTSQPITADLGTDGLPALASAVNAVRAATGITAEVSPDGARIHLYQADGHTITLGRFSHSGGGGLGIDRLDQNGAALGAQTALTGDGTQSARIEGTVNLSLTGGFSVSEGGVWTAATTGGFTGGPIDRSTSLAGARQTFSYTYDGTQQGASYGSAGAAPIVFDVDDGQGTLHSYSLDPSLAGAADGADAAAAMATTLRRTAPESTLTGAALANLPPDAAQLGLRLGSQSYTVTMVDGAPVVTGPEAGRVTASFDAANRLTLQTVGGHLDGAALELATDPLEAARFGMGVSDSPTSTLLGQPFDGAGLPASFDVELGGDVYTVSASAGGLSLPAGFPGTASFDAAEGRFGISFDAAAGPIRIPPQAGALAAGFETLGAEAQLLNGQLQLTATDGRVLQTTATSSGSGVTLQMDNLPNEDLLVVMQGAGALRLSGAVTVPADPPLAAPRELRVLDAASGQVGLYDAATGAEIAVRTLDENRATTIGGMEITLAGTLATGDSFAITPNLGGAGDASNFERIADLVQFDQTTGTGGFAAMYSEILSDIGSQVAAGKSRVETAQAFKDGADQAEMERSAVDLDEEAARLLQQQQAYQANAQVLNVARQLFDTLINTL